MHGSSEVEQPSPDSELRRESDGEADRLRNLLRDLTIATRQVLPAELEALSATEAAALYIVLDRYTAELWHVHRQTLYPLLMATIGQLAAQFDEPDEPADPGAAH